MSGFERSPAGGPEIGGILIGTRTEDRVRVLGHRVVSCEHAIGPSFELSGRDHAALEKLLQVTRDTEESILVGWYHSEYWNLCLTRQSADFHERYLPEPWQVALVLHRQKAQPVHMGFFVRDRSGVLKGSAPEHELIIELTQRCPTSLVRGRLCNRERDGVWLSLAVAHTTAWWDSAASLHRPGV